MFRNLEKDPRAERSFPIIPTEYEDYGGWDFQACDLDQHLAKVKSPKTDKEVNLGPQIDINTVLARKGLEGDLLYPDLDEKHDDYSRKKDTKRKRGRKNKF